MMRKLLMVAVLALLAACTTAPRRISADSALLAAQVEREAALAREGAWKLTGRLAVSDGRDGGSGRIEWIQDGDTYQITLNAPVTRQSWKLAGNASFARLDGLEGGPFFGDDAESLLAEHVGWQVPFSDLIAWMRGARASGPASMEFGETGLPALIVQRGWRIEYRAFNTAPLPLPTKVFAAQGERKVRMQVDRWETAR